MMEDDEIIDEGDFEMDDGDDDYCYEGEDDSGVSDAIKGGTTARKETASIFMYTLNDLVHKEGPTVLRIFKFLQDLMRRTTYLDLDWTMNDEEEKFFKPIITFVVGYAEHHQHSVQLIFNRTNFDENPFQIQPLQSMEPQAYYSLVFHPFLMKSKWNPFRDFAPVFGDIREKLKIIPTTDFILGGHNNVENISSTSADTLLQGMSLESLITKWYARAIEEIPFEAWTTGNIFDDVKSEVGRMAKAKQTYIPYKGTGYLAPSTADSTNIRTSPKQKLLEAIEQRLSLNSTNEIMINWVLASPLKTLVMASLKEFNGYFLESNAAEWLCLFHMLSHLTDWSKSLSLASFPVDEAYELFRALCNFYLGEIESNTMPTALANLVAISTTIREITTTLVEEVHVAAVLSCEMSQQHAASSSSAAEITAYDFARRVYTDVPNMSAVHYFLQGKDKAGTSTSSNSCSSSSASTLSARAKSQVMRELKFLQRELIPQITVFVSDESLQYMMFTITIDESSDNPYYGGIYVFHMKIPEDYPQKNPSVQFVTTGGGRVRFNPNLYNGGKVCLSLLGTWAGPGWDPKESSLNQLMMSIYHLIFTEAPFFNEPGYEQKRSSYLKQSDEYSARVRKDVVSAALMYHIQHPCPVLRTWIHGCAASLWPRCRSYFHENAEKNQYTRSDLTTLDTTWGTVVPTVSCSSASAS